MRLPRLLQNPRNRNLFLGGAACGAAAAGLYLYASRVEARRFKLESINVITGSNNFDSNIPSVANPLALKILHLSDLHLAYPESEKIEFIRRITDNDYDLIVITGDIFENYTGLQYASSLISRKPRLGAYAVLGNHDYYDYTMFHKTVGRMNRRYRHPDEFRDVTPMIEALTAGGITVMRNTSETHAADRVHIVGVDYPGITNAQLRSLVEAAPDKHLILLLFHIPERLERFSSLGVHMAFGGHTHGGQIRIPGIGALITDSELSRHEASGLLWRDNTAIHISRGLGADPRTNIRFFCPPHASIINLKHFA